MQKMWKRENLLDMSRTNNLSACDPVECPSGASIQGGQLCSEWDV